MWLDVAAKTCKYCDVNCRECTTTGALCAVDAAAGAANAVVGCWGTTASPVAAGACVYTAATANIGLIDPIVN